MPDWNIGLVSVALEAAVAAQFAFVSIVAALKARRGRDTFYFLAGLSGAIAFMIFGNLLTAQGPGFSFVNSVNVLLELLVGPLLILFLKRSQLDPEPLKPSDILHVTPAVAGAAMLVLSVRLLDEFIAITLAGYAMASWIVIVRKRTAYSGSFLRFSIALTSILSIAIAMRIYVSIESTTVPDFRASVSYVILLAAVLLAVWLILFVNFLRPEVLSASPIPEKYAQTRLDAAQSQALLKKLEERIQSDQPHLDPNLTLDDLASAIDAQPRHLSQVINTHYEMNFSAFINAERIEAAAQKLSEANADTQIKSIMYDSGFRSKTAFNREFKKVYGVTPSEYREQNIPH